MIESATANTVRSLAQPRTPAPDKSGKRPSKLGPEKASGMSGNHLKKLTSAEKTEVQKLKARDQEVRTHEQAHQAAGGQYVTQSASYSYTQGPDGQRYATGGEVGIDTSAESDPQATIIKMQAVRAAAMAPANPSGQDRQVAAKATSKAAEARAKIRAEQTEETAKSPGKNNSNPATGPESAYQVDFSINQTEAGEAIGALIDALL